MKYPGKQSGGKPSSEIDISDDIKTFKELLTI